MNDHDGHYAKHLAAVNERQTVRAAQDVYSVHGVLVARRGASIDYDTARKIVRHKLTMPLDKNIEVTNAISASALHRRSLEAMAKFKDLEFVHQGLNFGEPFETIATKLDLPPLVSQKMTVMALRQPELTSQSLLGAWFAALIGRELKLDAKELALLYLAGVSRDVGMLHIDPRLLGANSTARYGSDEWKALQSHVVASHMILKECDALPERVLDAVIQHHENLDGTGYPSNFQGAELGLMGQILSIADTVVGVRVGRLQGSGRNIRDAQIVLQMEADVYRSEVLSAAVKILDECGVKRTTFHEYAERSVLFQTVHRRARALLLCRSMLNDMPNLMPIEKAERLAPRVLTTFIERLNRMLTRSGMADPELVRWLEWVANGKDVGKADVDVADLTSLDLQQQELLWQFRRLQLNMVGFAEREGMRAQSPIRLMLDRMESFFEHLENDRLMSDSLVGKEGLGEHGPIPEGSEDDGFGAPAF